MCDAYGPAPARVKRKTQRKNKMRTLSSTLAALIIFTGSAHAEGTFQIGPQIGYSDFHAGKDADADLDNGAVGLVARYTVPLENNMFVGVQFSLAKEFSEFTAPTEKAIIDWSVDIMPRIGYNMGKVSLSIAAGLSFAKVKTELNQNGGLDKESQTHLGWKIAPGIDYKVSENMTLFGQVYHARYKSKEYTSGDVPSDISLKSTGVNVGVLFNF